MTDQLTTTASGGLHVSEEFGPLLTRLDDIGPLIRREAQAAEAAGRLTPAVVQALHDSGVFRICIPRSLGGYEFSPRQAIQTVERVSHHDASTGWIVHAVYVCSGTTAAYVGEEAAQSLYGDGRVTLVAGQGTRPGTAVRVDGGYRLSGSWSFASGMHHADHLHSAAVVEQTGQVLILIQPKEQATLLGNWDVMGLRATGSIDYRLDDVFVPEAYAYDITTTEPVSGGALYRVGVWNIAGIALTGWALGVGRRALDELRVLARQKSGAPGATVDSAEFHADYARAEIALRSARAWALEVWAGIETALDAGGRPSTEQETLARLALINATRTGQSVCATAYKWAGTAALRDGDLQRVFRDMHAGCQHITSGPAVLHHSGRHLAGLAPDDAYWVFGELTGPK
ncbi:acyl-CoA dehydrogenase family protein [Streptomyces sp. GC420]|uniref:acyl-CoA dehydrogenase family protein n=1 Tax=Streptomyces sp. GC420 TaxID=2697568 RepID=UPI00141521DC|nr:acyl-CoA dehydrogenase family protein [Streptomyces sp. GC420]NBM16703.1 acyl-CoA dehydrogenase [Streptomyces sp. GC420]